MRFTLDIPTVVCLASLVFATQSVAVYVQFRVNRANRGSGWWLAGTVAQALGFFLMLALTKPSFAALALLANPLVISGQACLGLGIAKFLGPGTGRGGRLFAPVLAAALAAYYFFVFAWSDITGRSAVAFISTGGMSLLTSFILVRGRRRQFASSAAFTALVFLLFGLFQLSVALWTLLAPPLASYGDIGEATARIIAFAAPIVGSLLWTFGFVIMVNQRLNAENLEEREKLRMVFDVGPDAKLIARAGGGLLVDVNGGFLAMTGLERGAVLGRPIASLGLWEDSKEWEAFLSELRGRGGRVENRECRLLRADRSLFIGSLSARSLPIDGEEHLVCVIDDITERKRDHELVRHMATHDELTDLPTLRLFRDRLSMAMGLSRRNRSFAAVMFLDLDGFKAVNDGHGHDAGDAVLREVARRLRSVVRETDTVARGGGDEFLLVLADLHDPACAAEAARKILRALSRPYEYGGSALSVGASIGISLFPRDGEDQDRLVRLADEAMYRTKAAGKNGYRFAGPREG